jgi:transposase
LDQTWRHPEGCSDQTTPLEHGVECLSDALNAAKLVGEVARIGRFRCRAAFARHNDSAPVPVWPGHQTRHRPSRGGNRQLSAALHRIAVTQQGPGPGRDYLEKRTTASHTKTEAIRARRRRRGDAVCRCMSEDKTLHATATGQADLAQAA